MIAHPSPTIFEQAIDLTDGLYRLIDIVFAHDLVMHFEDRRLHDNAVALTGALRELLAAVTEELQCATESLGYVGALLGMLEPSTLGLLELLVVAAHRHGRRALLAVIPIRQDIRLCFAHVVGAARMGASRPVRADECLDLRVSMEALRDNLASFHELLRVLDPRAFELTATTASSAK